MKKIVISPLLIAAILLSMPVASFAISSPTKGKPNLGKCLKDKSSTLAFDKLAKTTINNIKTQATNDYQNVLNTSKVLSKMAGNLTAVGDGVVKDAKQFWDSKGGLDQAIKDVQGLDRSLEVLKGKFDNSGGILKGALQKKREEFQQLIATVDPNYLKSVGESLKGAIKTESEQFKTSMTAVSTQLDSIGEKIDKLKEFNPTTKEGWDKIDNIGEQYKNKLDEISKDIDATVANADKIIAEKSAHKIETDATADFLSDLKTKTTPAEVAQAVAAAESNPNISKSVVKEAKDQSQKVSNGTLQMDKFKNNVNAVATGVKAHQQQINDSLKNAQEMKDKVLGTKAMIQEEAQKFAGEAGKLKIPNTLEFTDKIAAPLKGVLDSHARFEGTILGVASDLENKIFESEKALMQYARLAQSGDPVALLNTLDGEVLQEINSVISTVTQFSGLYGSMNNKVQYFSALVTQGLPLYAGAISKLANSGFALGVANAALGQARGYLDMSSSGVYAQAATEQIFTAMQPVIGCLAPYWKYLTLVTLVTGKQFNLANFARASKPKNTRNAKCPGIKIGTKCYPTKDKKLIRAAGQSKKISQFIVSTLDEAKGGSGNIIKQLQDAISLVQRELA